MLSTVRAGQANARSPLLHLGLPQGWHGNQVLEPFEVASQDVLAGSWVASGVAESGTQTWNARTPSG